VADPLAGAKDDPVSVKCCRDLYQRRHRITCHRQELGLDVVVGGNATGVSTGGSSLMFASCVSAAMAYPRLEYTAMHVSPEISSGGVTISPLSLAWYE
jgi:hypothetical protein